MGGKKERKEKDPVPRCLAAQTQTRLQHILNPEQVQISSSAHNVREHVPGYIYNPTTCSVPYGLTMTHTYTHTHTRTLL